MRVCKEQPIESLAVRDKMTYAEHVERHPDQADMGTFTPDTSRVCGKIHRSVKPYKF